MYITHATSCNSLITYITDPETPYALRQRKNGDWNGVLVINFTPGPNGSQAFTHKANDKPVEKKPESTKQDQKRVARQAPEGCR